MDWLRPTFCGVRHAPFRKEPGREAKVGDLDHPQEVWFRIYKQTQHKTWVSAVGWPYLESVRCSASWYTTTRQQQKINLLVCLYLVGVKPTTQNQKLRRPSIYALIGGGWQSAHARPLDPFSKQQKRRLTNNTSWSMGESVQTGEQSFPLFMSVKQKQGNQEGGIIESIWSIREGVQGIPRRPTPTLARPKSRWGYPLVFKLSARSKRCSERPAGHLRRMGRKLPQLQQHLPCPYPYPCQAPSGRLALGWRLKRLCSLPPTRWEGGKTVGRSRSFGARR